MSNAEKSHEPEVLISNLSLPPGLMLAGSLGAHERYMAATRADGMEVTPVRSLFMRRMLARATMIQKSLGELAPQHERGRSSEDQAYANLVRAQHSSFRNDTGDTAIMARAFPTWRDSLRQMGTTQYITGGLPAVLYPGFEDATVVYDEQNAPFADRTFQPTVEEWRRLGLREDSEAQEVQEVIGERGFTGLTIDVFHLQRSHEGKRFSDPIELATRLARAGLVQSVHLSLKRLDSVGPDFDLEASTKYAHEAFASSPQKAERTLEGELLTSIAAIWREQGVPKTRIVLEEDPRQLLNVKQNQTAIIETTRILATDL